MKRNQIGERLRSAREQSSLSRDHASVQAGVSRTTLQQWENGATEASIEAIEKLAKLYDTTPQYLIFGDISVPDTPTKSSNDENYIDIPVYDVLASAGTGSMIFDEDVECWLKFPTWWFGQRRLDPDDVVGLYAKGDSMEPTIPDGSLLLIDKSEKARNVSDGKIYVVRADDELYVKRIERIFGVGLELISDNKDYQPITLDKKQTADNDNFFSIVGQVVHIGIDLPH